MLKNNCVTIQISKKNNVLWNINFSARPWSCSRRRTSWDTWRRGSSSRPGMSRGYRNKRGYNLQFVIPQHFKIEIFPILPSILYFLIHQKNTNVLVKKKDRILKILRFLKPKDCSWNKTVLKAKRPRKKRSILMQ